MSNNQGIELTPEEAAGVEECIALLGMPHPTAIRLHGWLSSLEVISKTASVEEMMSGVWKAVEFCKARSIRYPNVAEVRDLLVKRSESQAVADSEAAGASA